MRTDPTGSTAQPVTDNGGSPPNSRISTCPPARSPTAPEIRAPLMLTSIIRPRNGTWPLRTSTTKSQPSRRCSRDESPVGPS